MARFKVTPFGTIQLTVEEESLRDTEEAAWAAGQLSRDVFISRVGVDEVERQSVKSNTALITFINMTPTQIDSWVDTNVNSLSDARIALKLLAKILNVAVRRTIRNGI